MQKSPKFPTALYYANPINQSEELSLLSATQLDLFFTVILSSQHGSTYLSAEQLRAYTFKRFERLSKSDELRAMHKFVKAAFDINVCTDVKVREDGGTTYIIKHFFETLEVETDKSKTFAGIKWHVSPECDKYVKELQSNFTHFDLMEFVTISGAYAKTAYRLIKQYRHTGWLEMSLEDFRKRFDVPKSYQMCNIDTKVLKPIMTELTRRRDVSGRQTSHDVKPIPDLKIIKLKSPGRGRGGMVVTGIRFEWTPEPRQLSQQTKAKLTADAPKTQIPTAAGIAHPYTAAEPARKLPTGEEADLERVMGVSAQRDGQSLTETKTAEQPKTQDGTSALLTLLSNLSVEDLAKLKAQLSK